MNEKQQINEGLVLKALISLYKGTAKDFSSHIGIELNRLNYLYKMPVLPDEERTKILNDIHTHGQRWNGREVEKLCFFAILDKNRQQLIGKKNAENIISGDGNITGVDNSEITVSSQNESTKVKKKINELKARLKKKQTIINNLIEEKKTLIKTTQKLANSLDKIQTQFINLMNKIDDQEPN